MQSSQQKTGVATSSATLTSSRSFWLGLLLWGLMMMGYFTFVLNWILPITLSGFEYTEGGVVHKVSGWMAAFFGDGGVQSELQRSIANWGVTAASGMATLCLGFFVSKFSHKKATMISLTLLSVGFFGGFVNNYWFFLLTRFIMAVGGTALIVLIQPIISSFFTFKQSPYLSQVSVLAYPTAGLSSFLLISSVKVSTFLTINWRYSIAFLGALCMLLLVLYIVFGKDFDILKQSDNTEMTSKEAMSPNTYLGMMSESQTWYWIILFGFGLVAFVLPTLTLPNVMLAWNPVFSSHGGGNWSGIYGSLVFVGAFLGFVGGFYNKTNLPSKLFVYLTILFFWVGMLFLILSGIYKGNKAIALSYIAAFLVGFTSVAMQTVMLNMPHEYKGNTPKSLGMFMGYIWGGGYMIYTIIDAMTSKLFDVHKASYSTTSFPLLPFMPIFFVLVVFPIVLALIKESKPSSSKNLQEKQVFES